MTVVVDIFRVLASVSSTLMILSPIPSIYKMHKNKSTGVASIVPLASMLFNCHVTMLYGYMDRNIFPVVTTFLTGDVCSILYMAVFYWRTTDRVFARKVIAGFGGATLLSTLYAVAGGYGWTNQTRDGVTLTLGYICIIATVVLYTSPFEKIGQVLKHRSGVFIPIHMVVAGVASNGMWLVYAALVSEWIILAPNAFCFVMGCAQIVVYLVFHPRTHPLRTDTDGLLATADLEAGTVAVAGTAVPSPVAKKSIQIALAAESPCFVPMQSPPLVRPQVHSKALAGIAPLFPPARSCTYGAVGKHDGSDRVYAAPVGSSPRARDERVPLTCNA